MAVQNFVLELIEALLKDEELALTEEDIRFYDKGTTAVEDEELDGHIRWQNARYFNEDTNVVRSSILIVRISSRHGMEYVNFHVGNIYRLYRTSGMKGVLSTIREEMKSLKTLAENDLALMNRFQDYEAIREHLIVRPLNYDDNSKVLERGIYRKIGDMALVLYISLGHVEHNIISTMALREMLCEWNTEESDVFGRALENTMRLQPPELVLLSGGTLSAPKRLRFMEEDPGPVNFNTPLSPILTTHQEVNGAIAAFYPGVLERLHQMAGGDFYLVFSGISDVHIHSVNGKVRVSAMRTTLADMNRNANGPGETLSRQIYRYCKETGKLEVV